MYARDVRKLAKQLGLKNGPGVGYGVIGGFAATLHDTLLGRTLHLYVGTPAGAWPDIEAALSKPKERYAIRSITSDPKGGAIEVLFRSAAGMNKRIKSFLENELPAFAGMGFPGAAQCAFCKERLQESETVLALARPDCVALPLHEPCYYDYERQIGDQAYAKAAEPSRKLLPVVGAFLGGLICTIPWVLLYMVGFFASYAGIFIGLGANFGHKLLGGKPGKARVFWVILIIAVMVPIGTAAGELASLARSILDGSLATSIGYSADTFVLGDLFPLFRLLWEDAAARAEMIPILAKNLALGYLFAGLGGFSAYLSFLRRENKPSRAKLERL